MNQRKPFYLIACAHAYESEGQMQELRIVAEQAGVRTVLRREELPFLPFQLGKGVSCITGCSFDGNVCLIEKEDNPDLICALRAGLNFTDGVAIPFGHNPRRTYFREGKCWTAKDFCAAVGELKRLCPLYNRDLLIWERNSDT